MKEAVPLKQPICWEEEGPFSVTVLSFIQVLFFNHCMNGASTVSSFFSAHILGSRYNLSSRPNLILVFPAGIETINQTNYDYHLKPKPASSQSINSFCPEG